MVIVRFLTQKCGQHSLTLMKILLTPITLSCSTKAYHKASLPTVAVVKAPTQTIGIANMFGLRAMVFLAQA